MTPFYDIPAFGSICDRNKEKRPEEIDLFLLFNLLAACLWYFRELWN